MTKCSDQKHDQVNSFEEHILRSMKIDSSLRESLIIETIKGNQQYRLPYKAFIKFKIDSLSFIKYANDRGLSNYFDSDSTFKNCLNEYGFFYKNKFWLMKPKVGDEWGETETLRKWWIDKHDSASLFAGFYNDVNNKIIMNCVDDKWNGRVITTYNKGFCYILIECFEG